MLRHGGLALMLAIASLAADQTPVAKSDDPPPAAQSDSRPHIHFGGLMLGAGYSHYSGYPYGGYYPGYWDAPYYYPGYYTGFAYGPRMGEVKLQQLDKSAMIYLDGAFAGPAEKLKRMWLDPGTYRLEVRKDGQRFTQKIYVLSGKTLKVNPEMMTREDVP